MDSAKEINVLAIESSCDETATAIVAVSANGRGKVLSEEISSQTEIHTEYGGVVPELAARSHLDNLPVLVDKVMKDAGVQYDNIDCVAVTAGPGLKGCLLMGVGFAKGLAIGRKLPLVGVNHIEGHILAPVLDNPELTFPHLSLVVSGGHTEILCVEAAHKYRLIARTIDDAAGEAFDKSAHLLGFTYPGGPQLAALADTCEGSSFTLPKVMREAEGFSFSGLKTAIAQLVQKNKKELAKNEELRASLAWAIQDSIIDALLFKLKRAVKETGIKKVSITGGVSANRALRKQVSSIPGLEVFLPKGVHCMDNAGMIGYVGGLRFLRGDIDELDLGVNARWPVELM